MDRVQQWIEAQRHVRTDTVRCPDQQQPHERAHDVRCEEKERLRQRFERTSFLRAATGATTAEGLHLSVDVRWQGNALRALIDSGAQGNFITPEAVNRLKIPWKVKKRPYSLRTVDGSPSNYDNGFVQRETDHLTVEIDGRHQGMQLDITELAGDDIILGLPWLRTSNPRIDWANGLVRWVTSTPTRGSRPLDAQDSQQGLREEAREEGIGPPEPDADGERQGHLRNVDAATTTRVGRCHGTGDDQHAQTSASSTSRQESSTGTEAGRTRFPQSREPIPVRKGCLRNTPQTEERPRKTVSWSDDTTEGKSPHQEARSPPSVPKQRNKEPHCVRVEPGILQRREMTPQVTRCDNPVPSWEEETHDEARGPDSAEKTNNHALDLREIGPTRRGRQRRRRARPQSGNGKSERHRLGRRSERILEIQQNLPDGT